MPVLYLLACAAPPTSQIPDAAAGLRDDGWDVWVTCTPEALHFLDPMAVYKATGNPVYTRRGTPKRTDLRPAPDAVAAVPVTFNTLNKWALGICDNSVLGVLHETSWSHAVPVVAAVWAKQALRTHPTFEANVALIASAGVVFLPHGSGYGDYDWHLLRTTLASAI